MTTNQLPAKYARLTPAEAAHMASMTQDAIADGADSPAMREHLAHLLQVARLNGPADTAPADDVTVGRKAGSAAANQFGTFTVHAASPAQVKFLTNLVAEKDTTGVTVPSTLDGISKKAASALIEKLIDRPRKAGAAPTTGPRPASEKQVAFVTRLLGEKDLTDTAYTKWTPEVIAQLTGREASAAIDDLMNRPRKPKVEVKPLAAGAYRVDGRVIRVYLGQRSGRMLAQELVDAAAENREDAWKYLGQADRFVPADAHRMTPEECEAASAGSADHGWCCVCGRRLDDIKSVERGIGPVCRAKQMGEPGNA